MKTIDRRFFPLKCLFCLSFLFLFFVFFKVCGGEEVSVYISREDLITVTMSIEKDLINRKASILFRPPPEIDIGLIKRDNNGKGE